MFQSFYSASAIPPEACRTMASQNDFPYALQFTQIRLCVCTSLPSSVLGVIREAMYTTNKKKKNVR